MSDNSAPTPRREVDDPAATFGLALSGGGVRASLFAAGTLVRIHELGLFRRLTRVTAVSGGSITLGLAAMHWNQLREAPPGDGGELRRSLLDPLTALTGLHLDWPNIIKGVVTPGRSAAEFLEADYRRHLFGNTMMSALPCDPDLVFYATSLQTGRSVRITPRMIRDHRVGRYPIAPTHDIPLALAVAASTAFPPFFAPVTIKGLEAARWEGDQLSGDVDEGQRRTLLLGDGGIYDNMGIEAHWQDPPDFLLVSDSGLPFSNRAAQRSNWWSVLRRTLDIMADQQRALRVRQLMREFKSANPEYRGALWRINTRMADHLDGADARFRTTVLDSDSTASLSKVKTQLRPIPPSVRQRLVNWGYAQADTAIRRRLLRDAPVGVLPYPETPP